MKRVLFSLTQIPLWLFIGCFFGSVLLGSPLQCHAQTFSSGGILSQQNVDNSNSIDQTMTAFENTTQAWQSVFTKYAEELFWILAPIGMVWRFGQIALKGEGLTEALAELVRFTIFIGFYYWLLENGTQITQAIVHSMEKMAGTAAYLKIKIILINIFMYMYIIRIVNKDISLYLQNKIKSDNIPVILKIVGIIKLCLYFIMKMRQSCLEIRSQKMRNRVTLFYFLVH